MMDLEVDASVADSGLMDKHLASLLAGIDPQPKHMPLQSTSNCLRTQPSTRSSDLDPMPPASSSHIAFEFSVGVQKFVASANTKQDDFNEIHVRRL